MFTKTYNDAKLEIKQKTNKQTKKSGKNKLQMNISQY